MEATRMTDDLLDILREIVDNYDSVDDLETKILEDVADEIRTLLFERATTINTLSDMWDQDDGET